MRLRSIALCLLTHAAAAASDALTRVDALGDYPAVDMPPRHAGAAGIGAQLHHAVNRNQCRRRHHL